MNQPQGDLAAWVQSLVSRSLQDQLQSLQRYGDLLKKVSAGGPEQTAVRDRYASFVRDQRPRFIHELATLSLAYHEKLFQLSREFHETLFGQVLGSEGVPHAPATAASETQHLEMQLAGPQGGEATGSIVIENQRAEAAEASFRVSEFTGPDGSTTHPALEILPSRFLLGPLEQQVVTLRLSLSADLFATPGPYRCSIQVQGQVQLVIALTVVVEDPVPKPVDQSPLAPPTSPAPPKRRAPAQKRKPAPRANAKANGRKAATG